MDNSAQRDYWNASAGDKWAREADVLDAMLAPFNRAVLDAVRLKIGEHVLDIGCGAGSLSLLAARETPQLNIAGVDISEPLAALARHRAEADGLTVAFIVADASEWTAPHPIDALISRFGVMFFADPQAAFSHLHAQMKPGGRMAFACWRALAENPWALAPLQIAKPFFRQAPEPADPAAPGPFAFAETARLDALLQAAGWRGVAIERWSGEITLPGYTAEATATFMMEIGPLARLLKDQEIDPQPVHAALSDFVRSRMDAGGQTRLGASVSIVTATA